MFMNHDSDDNACARHSPESTGFISGLFLLTNPCRPMPISFPLVGYKTTWGL